jgi:hypothetical protein
MKRELKCEQRKDKWHKQIGGGGREAEGGAGQRKKVNRRKETSS